MKKILLLLPILFCTRLLFAQSAGEISGKVLDEKGKPLENATIAVFEGGGIKGGTHSNNFGSFTVKPLFSGTYTVKVSYLGYTTEERSEVVVTNGQATTLKFNLVKKSSSLKGAVIKAKNKAPIIDVGKPGQTSKMTSQQIERLATTSVTDAASLRPGVYQKKAGGELNLGGGRATNTAYMIDGVLVRDANRAVLIPGTVDQIEVVTSGMPANLGDATGGVPSFTTKGSAEKHTGTLGLKHSVDGYNNNQAFFNLRGPLVKRKVKDSTASNFGKYVPLLGYTINGSAQYDVDNDPSFNGYYRISDALLNQLEANPIRPSSTGIFASSAEFIRADQLQKIKARQNGQAQSYSMQGKLTFSPSQLIDVTLGATGVYNINRNYNNLNSIFAPNANSTDVAITGRGFLRFRQTLSKPTNGKANVEQGLISNAYYTIQANYEKDIDKRENPLSKQNVFNYGYVGKFVSTEKPVYTLDTTVGGYRGIKLQNFTPDSVSFTPNYNYNPILANYTTSIYGYMGNTSGSSSFALNSLDKLQALGGMRNGDDVKTVFSKMYNNIGSSFGSITKSELDQYSLNMDASFDINPGIKNKLKESAKHAIEFGLYYEQRNSRSYSLNARQLWTIMRLKANAQLQTYDLANPTFRVDGKDYSLADLNNGVVQFSDFDTINIARKYVADAQFNFDKNLRAKLGMPVNGTNKIDIDALDPSTFSLNMFNADELYSIFNSYSTVNYNGYDYLGKKLSKKPSFADFWTKKDGAGNYVRGVAGFQPIYVAGYLQDNFKYKDLRFRLGVRVDRYDANQKVLRNPYSFNSALKVSDLQAQKYEVAKDATNGNALAPDPLKDPNFYSTYKDYYVYVATNDVDKPKIIGYRNGDKWYDPFGKEIADPSILTNNYGTGDKLQPFLLNKNDSIGKENYNVNGAFTDYKPRVNISPRISFSFPIDGDNSLFYAHYDQVNQRPSAGAVFASADDYYYIASRTGQTLANANLSPEKLIDYEVGFQQKLSKNSGITISAFYKERKDQIQVQQIAYAWPQTYRTYANRDFSTTKGFTCFYDLRSGDKPFGLNLSYTLQFADGTGSSSGSQNSILNSGQPNTRVVMPLDFDSRHNISLNADYRLNSTENKGPKIGNKYPFKNVGFNFTVRARSGEPYTKYSLANSVMTTGDNASIIVGTVNGNRQPWNVNTDLRIDKDFELIKYAIKKDADGKTISNKRIGCNVYAYAQNLLNTKNILGVYSYTGNATDDGYLSSSIGQQYISSLTNKLSFIDLYTARLNDPGHFVNPRRVFVGINFNF